MKVKQKGKVVVITLEKEEARLMEHALNCAFSKSLERYCKEHKLDGDALYEFTTKLWAKLDTTIYGARQEDKKVGR